MRNAGRKNMPVPKVGDGLDGAVFDRLALGVQVLWVDRISGFALTRADACGCAGNVRYTTGWRLSVDSSKK
jgi:hypothetical protein